MATAIIAGCSDPTGVDESEHPTEDQPEFAIQASGGTTYYVSLTGNDRKSGTSLSNAWRTLGKVSSTNFGPGDRILFQGGAVFPGKLYLDANDRGTAALPITVSSFGTGRAIIDGGNGDAIFVYNAAGFAFTNLILQGSGRTVNTGSGLNAYVELGGNVKLDYLRIDNVEARGFGKYGILIGSWNGTTGYKNVSVTNSSAHDNALAGILTYAQLPKSHQNLYFGHLQSWGNSGKAGLTGNNGNGIVLGGVSGGTIERSVAHDNGWLCNAQEGPVGIWTYDSDRIIIQYNESYANHTAGPADGGGFDLDQNTSNSTLQYNYSHGNDGPGFLFSHAPNNFNHTGNTIRYNISENDGRKNSGAGILIWGRTIGAEIYNNTVYTSPSASGKPHGLYIHNYTVVANDVKNVHIRDNSFYVTGGLPVIEVSPDQLNGAIDLKFQGNNYYGGTTQPKIIWGGATYSSLTAWRTGTTQETLNGAAVGSQVDPQIVAAGNGGTIGNADLLVNLGAYKLRSTSPLINRAINLKQMFGLILGTTDFYGSPLPMGLGYDVGAHEWK